MKRALAAAALLVAAGGAVAHDAPSGWSYDPECCNTRDCSPAPAGTVREERRGGVLGYAVVIPLGMHHNARVAVDEFIPLGDPRIRVSGDDQRHACVSSTGRVYCIYIAPGGV